MNEYKSLTNSLVRTIAKSINTMSGVSELPPGIKQMNPGRPSGQRRNMSQDSGNPSGKGTPSVRRTRPDPQRGTARDESDFVRKDDMYDQVEAANDRAYVDKDLEGIEKYKKLKSGAYHQKNTDAFGIQKPKKKVRHPILEGITKSELKRGIIFSEVLGKPKSLQ